MTITDRIEAAVTIAQTPMNMHIKMLALLSDEVLQRLATINNDQPIRDEIERRRQLKAKTQ